jgi:hypothetical protein
MFIQCNTKFVNYFIAQYKNRTNTSYEVLLYKENLFRLNEFTFITVHLMNPGQQIRHCLCGGRSLIREHKLEFCKECTFARANDLLTMNNYNVNIIP